MLFWFLFAFCLPTFFCAFFAFLPLLLSTVVISLDFFDKFIAAFSCSTSSFSGVSVRIRVLPRFLTILFALRGPALGSGRITYKELGLVPDVGVST